MTIDLPRDTRAYYELRQNCYTAAVAVKSYENIKAALREDCWCESLARQLIFAFDEVADWHRALLHIHGAEDTLKLPADLWHSVQFLRFCQPT